MSMSCLTAYGQSRSSRLPPTSSEEPDGVLAPWRVSDVACVETGIVDEIAVSIGEYVQPQAVLARLESKSIELQLMAARAQAASTGRRDAASAEVELNQRRLEAIRNARHLQHSSQSELDRAEADLKISQGRLASEVEERHVLQLQVERLSQQLQQRTIVAPFAGVIVELHKEVGEFVAPNSPEVLRLVDISKLRTSFFLHEHEVRAIAKSPHCQVRLGDGSQVTATVEHIAPVADGESGLIEVRVLVDNPDAKILGARCSLLIDAPRT
ncbi:MAG: efflux RND transporter periplasmic adaptor subunit [Pirellulaceae bacterium]